MIHAPPPNDRVQHMQHVVLRGSPQQPELAADLSHEGVGVLFRRPSEEEISKFPEVPTQEVEAFVHMRDLRLAFGEREPSFREELDDDRLDLAFQDLRRGSCDDKRNQTYCCCKGNIIWDF